MSSSGLPELPGIPDPTTKLCPYCREVIQADAERCKHCRTWLRGNPLQSEWFRSPGGRIAGVCKGLSDQFQISATFLRIVFVLTTLFCAGIGLVAYITLWFIMPVHPDTPTS